MLTPAYLQSEGSNRSCPKWYPFPYVAALLLTRASLSLVKFFKSIAPYRELGAKWDAHTATDKELQSGQETSLRTRLKVHWFVTEELTWRGRALLLLIIGARMKELVLFWLVCMHSEGRGQTTPVRYNQISHH